MNTSVRYMANALPDYGDTGEGWPLRVYWKGPTNSGNQKTYRCRDISFGTGCIKRLRVGKNTPVKILPSGFLLCEFAQGTSDIVYLSTIPVLGGGYQTLPPLFRDPENNKVWMLQNPADQQWFAIPKERENEILQSLLLNTTVNGKTPSEFFSNNTSGNIIENILPENIPALFEKYKLQLAVAAALLLVYLILKK